MQKDCCGASQGSRASHFGSLSETPKGSSLLSEATQSGIIQSHRNVRAKYFNPVRDSKILRLWSRRASPTPVPSTYNGSVGCCAVSPRAPLSWVRAIGVLRMMFPGITCACRSPCQAHEGLFTRHLAPRRRALEIEIFVLYVRCNMAQRGRPEQVLAIYQHPFTAALS